MENEAETHQTVSSSARCQWDQSAGQFIVKGFDDVVEILKHHDVFSSVGPISVKAPNGNRSGPNTILLSDDPPRHTHIRNLVNRWFTAKELESMRPWIERTSAQLLDTIDPECVDITQAIAEPLAVMSIARLLGLDPQDWPKFKQWSLAASGLMSQQDSTTSLPSLLAMYRFLSREIADRKNAPRDDLISRMIAGSRDSIGLADTDLQGLCALILAAGNETTVNLISNMVDVLCDRQDIWHMLRANELRASAVVEETLRFDSPVQFIRRFVRVPIEFDGCSLQAGDRVGLDLGNANRDEEQFDNSNVFDPLRSHKKHVAFSHGVHFCLGALLARMEAEVLLQSMVRRYSGLSRLAPGRRLDSKVMRGFESLRVKLVSEPHALGQPANTAHV